MKFIPNFFSCDKKASRKEFIIYLIIYSILIVFFIPLFAYIGPLAFPIIPFFVFLFTFPIFRRAKDIGMTNETIINYLIKISLLIWTGFPFALICALLYCLLHYKNGFALFDFIWSILLFGIAIIYIVIFLFQLIFLKGKNTEENLEYNTNLYEKKTLIKKIFNRDFIVGIFNFKGKTSREGGWIYFGIGFITSVVILLKGNMLFKIYDYIGTVFFSLMSNYNSSCIGYEHPEINYTWQWWALGIIFLLLLSLSCRRLRDLNIKPWKVVFLLIPPVNIFLIVLMLFGKTEE